jgi:hypothetical protein
MEKMMEKNIWYGIKNNKVRLFAQDPTGNSNVTGVGQCTLTSEGGNLDVIYPDGGSLFSETTQHQSSQSGQATA